MPEDVLLAHRHGDPYPFSHAAVDKYLQYIHNKGRKKPERETAKWKNTIGLNTRVNPLLHGRGEPELVVRIGGRRKPRKKG